MSSFNAPVWLNAALKGVGKLEAVLANHLRVPFGTSARAFARKRA